MLLKGARKSHDCIVVVVIVHIIIINIIIKSGNGLTAAIVDGSSSSSSSRSHNHNHNHNYSYSHGRSPEFTISECAAKVGECDESKGRPVCGTDDQTYPSRCHLLRVQCSGHQVSIKYRGPCKACTEARDYALKHRSRKPPKFIPRCKRDGTYALVQCLANTGCWCSDVSGKPIENTSVRTGKPKCRAFSKKANKRRSPSRNLGDGGRTISNGNNGSNGRGGSGSSNAGNRNNGHNGNGRRSCNQDDRLTFNHNLLKIFQTEYSRMLQQKQQHQQQQQQKTILNTVGRTADNGGDVSVDKLLLDSLAMSHDNKVVIDWKFANLDANKNEMLDKIEYRELKKLVKRAVKPRRCGRAFGKFCDLDKDERLSHFEWNNCLSKDAINRHTALRNTKTNSTTAHSSRPMVMASTPGQAPASASASVPVPVPSSSSLSTLQNTINYNDSDYSHNHSNKNNNKDNNSNDNNYNNNNNNNNNNGDRVVAGSLTNADDTNDDDLDDMDDDPIDYDDEADYDDGDDLDTEQLSILNVLRSPTKFPSIHFLVPNGPNSSRQETETESNCLTDQAAALEDQNHSSGFMYVPDCTPDGRYQRVQCYRSTPYCWCVNEETGKNILGTSVKDRRPQCDNLYTTMRPMKGCPEPRKTTFLKELKEYLKSHIIAKAYTSSNNNNNKWNNEDERIGTLSFTILDKNQNKFWERKEWKIFRELVTNTKTLRKCGKKMPRYCDANSDKKISLNEWISCLQVQNYEILNAKTQTTTTNHSGSGSSKALKLSGSNPLEQYLKD